MSQISDLHRAEEAIHREGEVAESDEQHYQVTHDGNPLVMSLGDFEACGRNNLSPSPAGMQQKDASREHVKHDPDGVLEQIKLELVNISNSHGLD